MNRYTLQITTDAAGAGTVRTPYPFRGHLQEIGYFGTIFAGTATYTFTRDNGGTVLAYTAAVNPWRLVPEEPVDTVSGGSVLFGTVGGVTTKIPIDGYCTLKISAGGSVVTDSVDVYVEGEAG